MKIQILPILRQITTKATPLFLLGAVLNFGVLSQSAAAQVSETQVNALVEALRLAAPPDSPDDGMYSDWQVLPGTLQGWSEECLGQSVTPAEFEADPEIARSVVSCVAEWQLEEQSVSAGTDELAAIRQAACWWMTGESTGCDSGFTAEYVEQVLGFYQEQMSSPQS
ncbi:MAG: hypothetical protein WBG66_06170 [Geitlerinemataceae cyanobacterium]